MPLFFAENLDDTLVYDGTTSFAGGQVSNVRANLLKTTESAELINCDITKEGELSTRRGTLRIGPGTAGDSGFVGANDYVQGLTHFETPTVNFPIAVTGGTPYKFDGTNWVLACAAPWNAIDNRVHVFLVQGTNKLYVADGTGNLASWDGVATGFTDLGGSTNAKPPNHPYFIVWHTSRLVAVGRDDPDAIYFSQFLDGSVWDRAKWSLKVGNTGGGTTGGFPSGTNDPITGLFSWLDFNLIVFKRSSTWLVNCDPELQVSDANNTVGGFKIKPVHQTIGCIAPLSAAQVGSDVWYLSTNGVRSVKRTLAAETQSEVSDPESLPVQDVIARITANAANKAVGFFWNNHYFLALPLDGAAENNYVLIYNFLTDTWSGLWTGWAVTNFAELKLIGQMPRLMFGQSDQTPDSSQNGTVYEWLDYVQPSEETDATYQDQDAVIPTLILSRALTSNDPVSPKTGINVTLEFHNSQATANILALLDSGSAQKIVSTPTGAPEVLLPEILPFTLPDERVIRPAFDLQHFGPYRELQIQVSSPAQKLVLHAILVSAFIETVQLQSAS